MSESGDRRGHVQAPGSGSNARTRRKHAADGFLCRRHGRRKPAGSVGTSPRSQACQSRVVGMSRALEQRRPFYERADIKLGVDTEQVVDVAARVLQAIQAWEAKA